MKHAAFLAVALLTFAQALAAADRPNVLFIISDDMDCRIGCYGDPIAKTPNLDRLAASGVRFDRAYCQFPLCNPTRSSVLSGRYPTSTGVLDNNTWLILDEGQAILPRYFEQHGYAVAEHGKIWHAANSGFQRGAALPVVPARAGRQTAWFTPDERAAQQRENPRYWDEVHSPYRNLVVKTPEIYAAANEFGPLPAADPGPDVPTANKAIASMREFAAGERPFFLAVGFIRPHVPLKAPQEFFDLYEASQMPLPPDFANEPQAEPTTPPDELRRNMDLFSGRSFSAAEAREAMRAYYASTTYMDAQLGRVLDELERLGIADNTLIVFWGDHGWHLSEKGMWAKGTLFEVAARAPLIVVDPRKRTAGQSSERTVQFLDIYPTLVALCGLPSSTWLEGTSLAPLLDDPRAAWDRPAYTVQVRDWFVGRSVRTERWRYTEWDEGRRGSELYDHAADTHEMRNLAYDPQHADTVSLLRKLLHDSPVAAKR